MDALNILMLFGIYLYCALCLHIISNKVNINAGNGWMAWIPIANVFLMLQISGRPSWWFLLFLIPIVNLIVGMILWMDISEARQKPRWLGVLVLIPYGGLFFLGYLAFSK